MGSGVPQVQRERVGPGTSRNPGTSEPRNLGFPMTKAELVEEVSRVSDLTKKHSEVIVDTVFKSIVDALHRGEKIELRGFGSFRLRRREPRKGRNPKTGDKVDVPPKKVPYFKPGKELKDLINQASDAAPNPIAELRASPMDRLWTPWRLAYVTEASRRDARLHLLRRARAHRHRAARRAPRRARRSSSSTSFRTTTAT